MPARARRGAEIRAVGNSPRSCARFPEILVKNFLYFARVPPDADHRVHILYCALQNRAIYARGNAKARARAKFVK